MFISVDFPAPFSPSSACTSPRWRSKSTWSLASTPGKRLVIPRSSRMGTAARSTRASAIAGDSKEAGNDEGRAPGPPLEDLRACEALDLGRNPHAAADDLLLQRLDLTDGR